MKKTLFMYVLVVLLIVVGTVDAGAQLRLEGNLSWPLTIGISSSNSLFSGSNVDLSQYHFLLPDFRIYYQFGEEFLHGGIGARVYTALAESFIYPEAFVEVDLSPIVLEAGFGGFVFDFFGLYNNLTTASLLIPDFNAAWQVAPWLRLGGGVLLFAPVGSNWSQNFVYMAYIGARFIFVLR